MEKAYCTFGPLWHDDIIKWKHLPHYWPFVWGIHWSPVNSPHKGQWCRALMFSLIWAWINGWVNNREAGDLRCHCTHYDVTVMSHQGIPFTKGQQYVALKSPVLLILTRWRNSWFKLLMFWDSPMLMWHYCTGHYNTTDMPYYIMSR